MKLSPQAKVKIVDLPGLPPKGDCVEWIEPCNVIETHDHTGEFKVCEVRQNKKPPRGEV